MREAFQRANHTDDFECWIAERKENSVQFLFWNTVFELESLLLTFVESIQLHDFEMFLSCLEQIAPWMFAMDHVHYARWLSVFINDLKLLPVKHPDVFAEFLNGKFTINRTGKPFSSIQANEQNNKLVKLMAVLLISS